MTLETGFLLNNRYQILEVIAKGGMGAIYKAKDMSLGVFTAVKENLFITEEGSRQFRKEATILAGVRHPNLPRVTDHFVIAGQGQYLVMDYIDGEDLREKLSNQKTMQEEETVIIGIAVCNALAYLHSQASPIVHRDIKPGNVKITPDGGVFLVDFGLAKVAQTGYATTIGAQALTPGYAPPEQYGKGTDPRSDIYSLGATLYAVLSGKVPEDGLSRAMGTVQLTPIRKYNPKISEKLAAVIEKSMAIDVNHRFQNATEFAEELNQTLAKDKRIVINQANTIQSVQPQSKNSTYSTSGEATRYVERSQQISPLQVKATSEKKKPIVWIGVAATLVVIASLVFIAIKNPFSQKDSRNAIQAENLNTATIEKPRPTPLPATPVKTVEPILTSTPENTPTADNISSPVPTVVEIPAETGQIEKIIFASDRSGSFQLWLMDADGNHQNQLTDIQDGACQPAWSPDGTKVVFISPCKSSQDIYKNSGLFVINADGSGRKLLATAPGGDFEPAWSPDGTQILFTSLRGGKPQLYLYQLDNNVVTMLSKPSTHDRQGVWSPTGEEIAFESTRLGPSQIWIMDLATEKTVEFSKIDGAKDYMPDWSPDGQTIVFSQGDSLPWLIARRFDQNNAFKIAEAIRPVYDPDFSSDNLWIVFQSLTDQNPDIYKFTANGSELTQLTTDPAVDMQPAWQPVQ